MRNNKTLVLTWPDATGQTVDVQFDVITSESYEAVMELTSHPVEKGAPVVDHAREQPRKLTIEAFVSNTPLMENLTDDELDTMRFFPIDLNYPDQKPQGAPLLTPGGLTKAVTGLLSSEPSLPQSVTVLHAVGEMQDRAKNVLEKLEDARTSRRLIRISTRFHDLADMLIESISIDRSVESAGGLPFQIAFTQVRIVESQFADLPVPSKPRAAKMVNKGSQQPMASTAYNSGVALGLFP